jgi:alpha-ribazole phosphatase
MGKKTEVIFIRHGETDFNRARLYFGHLDPDLNETGIEQLRKTKILFEKREKMPDVVFSSDLKRCSQSMEILEIDEEIEKILTEDLREINFGIFEGKTYEEIKSEYPEKVEKMINDWRNFKADRGESINEMMLRVAEKMNEIINQYRNKKILVVAHAGVIQALTSYYLFGNLDGYWKFKINNGSITKLHVMEDGYTYFEYINLT